MKWSEQMRVLNSEDEHYNQLIYDVAENSLYINEELIARLDENNTVDYDTFCDLKKKYPYIDDKNFLLNCLFKLERHTSSDSSSITTYFITGYLHPTNVDYAESESIESDSYIKIVLILSDENICNFILTTAVNSDIK